MHLILNMFEATLLVVAALFPIVNPLGVSLIFLGLTEGYTHAVRAALAWHIGINSFLMLMVSMLIGGQVLSFFGISLPVVQVGGGLVVIAMGWKMLQQDGSAPKPSPLSATDASLQAFYPLTMPLTVDPGSLAVAVALGANTQRLTYSWPVQVASAVLGPLLIGVSIFISFRSAERLEKLLGRTGMSVFLRLASFIVLCIGIQILWNGIAALVASLG